jgi:hypothetical protein
MPVPFIDVQDVSDLLGRDVTMDPGTLMAIDSACDMIRGITEQDFNRGTSTETLDGTDTDVLMLPQRPLNAILGTVMVNGAPELSYAFKPTGELLRGSAGNNPRPLWPRGRQNVTVTYDHGYDEVPRDVRMVAVQIAMRLIVQGVAQSETVGDVTISYGQPADNLTVNETRILATYLNVRSF